MLQQFNAVLHAITKKDFSRSTFALAFSLIMHGLVIVLVVSKSSQGTSAGSALADVAKPTVLQIHLISPATMQSDSRQTVLKSQHANHPQGNNQTDTFSKAQVPHKRVPALLFAVNLSVYYHHVEELTTPPAVQDNVEPSADLTLSMDGVPEKPLQLRVLVNENGDVDGVEIEASKLSDEATRMVKEQFMKMKFSPGMIGDFAVKSQFVIEVSLSAAARPFEFIEVSRKVLR